MSETIRSDYNEQNLMQQDTNQALGLKPPIIILHGWVVDPRIKEKWQSLLDLLTVEGFSIHFLFIPGLSAPLESVWSIDDYTQWLDQQLGSITHQPVILLGHSFGGHIAINFAYHHPQKITQLILIDSSGLRDHSLYANLKRNIFKKIATLGKLVTQHPTAQKLLYKIAREPDYVSASPLLRQTMAKVIEHEVTHEAPVILCPTLIIWGEQDKTTPLSLGQRLKNLLPNSQLAVIPEARHSPPYTHPKEVCQQIITFLNHNQERTQ